MTMLYVSLVRLKSDDSPAGLFIYGDSELGRKLCAALPPKSAAVSMLTAHTCRWRIFMAMFLSLSLSGYMFVRI